MATQCTATAKATGEQCARYAIEGGTTCRVHGGASPQARAAAARRVKEAEAARAVATLGLPLDVSPTDALLEEVRWTAGHVQWLRGKVQELHPEPTHTTNSLDGSDYGPGLTTADGKDALVWGTTKIKRGGEDQGTTEEAAPSIWYVLYAKERAHLVTVCQAAIKAGVEERRVRLAEQQGDLVATVIGRILDALLLVVVALVTRLAPDGGWQSSFVEEWQKAVSEVVPRELRAIAGGAA